MMSQDDRSSITVSVENIGGIRSCQWTLHSGVTVLTGRNATNRTSFLRALGAGLGGSTGKLKADTDEGSVAIEFDGERYTRTFERENGSVQPGGDPYSDNGRVVDQFSAILADNPARDAVVRGDNDALREFIMAPVDTREIEATIERKQEAIRAIRDDLDEAKQQRARLPDLERQVAATEEQLDEVRTELESVRGSIADFEADADDAQAAEAVVEDLKEAREKYEHVRSRLRTQRNALESLREEREEIESELTETAPPESDQGRIEDELERLQRRERDLENTINDLLSIVEFNQELVDDAGIPDLDDETVDVLDDLDPETQTVECWTCGTHVQQGAIDDRLDDLRNVVEEKRQERNDLRGKIQERQSSFEEIRAARRDRRALEEKLEDVDAEIAEREERIEGLEDQTTEVRERIEALEAQAAESDDLRDSDLLDHYQRLSELEYERGQLEEQIDSLEAELGDVREQAQQVAELEGDLEERRDELERARNRIVNLERRAVETFNDHVATVLELLEYENVERVWIERKSDETTSSDSVPDSSFTLHVVRSTEDGIVYEDTVDHLSESEREVIGLVVALAGYLVHDVHETVPVMVLDSLEAIDSKRIAALVEYFADFVPYLVVALLPDDASALPEEYDRIQMGEVPA